MSPFEALQLPNGQVISNRIAKAAMEENMADINQAPSRELMQLYQTWADGEPGLLITGNVMIDRRAMTGPGGVALENEQHLDRFREWADVARAKGVQFWVQLSHPDARPWPIWVSKPWHRRPLPSTSAVFPKCSPNPRP